ncbi:LysM peptidoglycan-binding domain-containing protein [Nocardioides sp. SOB77]|uniref:LysM peptidoglycan-binding domain-containing protein n=1 Tax=Nocardioides oceani TaxID=3058369 RepID=A0ABT8FAD0_9ACTN|nr:LysM peptidoglycan-binding domain-containing protein [Nocardioides oceani]MDN4171539.1 LysM peptidoglycan-binding domain-containing protein [Nocardioides oceani]
MSTITATRAPYVRTPQLAGRPATVRLTRRGRLVVFLLSLAFVLGVGLFIAAGSVATGEAGTPEPTRVVMVGTGDTLWGIAADLADDGDVRGMMAEIERLNALDTAVLDAGQRLVVPVS